MFDLAGEVGHPASGALVELPLVVAACGGLTWKRCRRGLSRRSREAYLPSFWTMSAATRPDGMGWTEQRQDLYVLIAERAPLLAGYYESAVYFLHTPDAPVRMSHLAHAIRELCNHLPDAVGVVKLERSNTENKVPVMAKVWEQAGLPDDVDEFPQCTAVDKAPDVRHIPRAVAAAAADVVVSSRIRGNSRRRAALMIIDPHAPVGHTMAERHPTVDRWVKIISKLFLWVHAFDKQPSPVPEDQLAADFTFLEEVIRGVLAPLADFTDLDDLLAQTRTASVQDPRDATESSSSDEANAADAGRQ
jgi:hypothetical protein